LIVSVLLLFKTFPEVLTLRLAFLIKPLKSYLIFVEFFHFLLVFVENIKSSAKDVTIWAL